MVNAISLQLYFYSCNCVHVVHFANERDGIPEFTHCCTNKCNGLYLFVCVRVFLIYMYICMYGNVWVGVFYVLLQKCRCLYVYVLYNVFGQKLFNEYVLNKGCTIIKSIVITFVICTKI